MRKRRSAISLLLAVALSISWIPGMLPSAAAEELVQKTEEMLVDQTVTTAPSAETTAPTGETAAPSGETTAPTEVTTAPTEETTAPTEVTTAPTEETTAPTEVTTAPTEETTKPTEETSVPTEQTLPNEESAYTAMSDGVLTSCGENLTWLLDEEGTLTISGTGDMTNFAAETETPWYDNRDNIRQIVVSEGVTSIGDNAFKGCSEFAQISLPQSLTRIGNRAFSGCYFLDAITIPAAVTEIGEKAFDYYGQTMVRVTFLGDIPQTPNGFPFFEVAGYGFVVKIFYDVTNSTWTEEAKQAFASSEHTKLKYIPCSNMTDTSGSCGDGLTWHADLNRKELTISGTGTMDSWGSTSAAPWNCFAAQIESVVLEAGVSNIGENAFTYMQAKEYHFQGDVPTGVEPVLEGKSCKVYYPADIAAWKTLKTQYPDCQWIANGSVKASLDALMQVYKTMTPEEIRAEVHSWDREELRQLMASGGDSLNLHYLEQAVCPGEPQVSITEDVPKLSGMATGPIMFSVLGAGLNNLMDAGQVPSLTLDKVGSAVSVPGGYLSDDAVQFSIRLGNIEGSEKLAVPISISCVLPEELNPFFQGLFWRNPETGQVEEISTESYWSKSGGMRFNFVIMGAGDYVLAQKADATVSGSCGDNLTWTYDSDYTLTISGSGEMDNYDESGSTQPWYKYGESVMRLVLEEGITSIGDYAFTYNCRFPDTITIPASVTRIGAGAFSDMFTTKFIFEGDVPEIKQDSFEGVAAMGYYPGDNATWQTVTDNSQWGGASQITWAPLSNSGSCGENLTWTMNEETGVLTISGTGDMDRFNFMDYPEPPWNAFYQDITKVILEEGVTSIGEMAFTNCVNLQEIVLPDSLTSIYAFAIPGTNLKELTIPANVTMIDPMSGIEDLQKIEVDEANDVYCSVDGVLFSKDKTTLVLYPAGRDLTAYAVPEGTQVLGQYAFSGNRVLRSLTLPSSLTKIDDNAVAYTCVKEIVIPENVMVIGSNAFTECEYLESITFRGDAPQIDKQSFTITTTTARYPAGNDTWTEEVRQNYGGTLTWVSYEPEDPTQGMTQAEFLEALDAAIQAGEKEYQLNQSVTFTESAALPEIMLRISGEDTVLTVSDGAVLDGNGQYLDAQGAQIVVESGGTLKNAFMTVANGADLTVKPGGTLICADQCGVLVWFSGALHVMEGANLVSTPGGVQAYLSPDLDEEPVIVGVDKKDMKAKMEFLSVSADADFAACFAAGSQYKSFELSVFDTCELKSDLLIPQNAMLETTYAFIIPQGVTVTNNGIFEVAVGDVTIHGTMVNNGTLRYYSERQLHINGTFQGNAPELADVGTLTQEELETMIREAVDAGEWLLGISKQVTLTRDLEIPAGIVLEVVQGGGFLLKKGVTLTCSGEIDAYNCTTIQVCDGAVLEVPGTIKLSHDSSLIAEKGGVLRVPGSLTMKDCDLRIEKECDVQISGTFQVSGDMNVTIPLSDAASIDGIVKERTTVTTACTTSDELMQAMKAGQGYRSHVTSIAQKITLSESMTVPANCVMDLGSGGVLEIPESVTLTNLGTIVLNPGSEILVNGTLDNQGELDNNGGVITDGAASGTESVKEDLENILNNAEELTDEEIRQQVQTIDRDTLVEAMVQENSDVTSMIQQLEAKLNTTTKVASSLPEIDGNQVSIVGAGLNGVVQEQSDITLVIEGLDQDAVKIPEEYDNSNALVFSMTLENVVDTRELDVPVMITLPVPERIDPERLVILHYHDGATVPEVVVPKVYTEDGQNFAAFALTGFSDFVLTQPAGGEVTDLVPMYRLYNPYTLEHLFTGSEWERDNLPNAGWIYEGVAWSAPTEGAPIYRLYNPYTDGHFYTASQDEIDMLLPLGWIMDGPVCNSASADGTPIYRLFNPYETKNYHHYTTSSEEISMLTSLGWVLEGVAWYAA